MNGQFCVTGSRVLVHRSIADQLGSALVDAIGSLGARPNQPRQSETNQRRDFLGLEPTAALRDLGANNCPVGSERL